MNDFYSVVTVAWKQKLWVLARAFGSEAVVLVRGPGWGRGGVWLERRGGD